MSTTYHPRATDQALTAVRPGPSMRLAIAYRRVRQHYPLATAAEALAIARDLVRFGKRR